MKKSFMTRALAMGLSFAMAFSLSAATNVTTASAAAKKASVTTFMKASSKTVTEGKSVTAYMKSGVAKKYRIKSHTESDVAKKYISVKMLSSRKGLTITAVDGAVTAANLEKKGVNTKIYFAPAKSASAVKKAKATKYVNLKVAVKAAAKQEEEKPVETNTLEMTGLTATKANELTATFASAVASTSAITIKVNKAGSTTAITGTTKWSDDATSVVFTASANLTAGTYEMTATDSADTTKTTSKTAVVENEKVSEIVILNDTALTDSTKRKAFVYYDVFNQYGESLKESTSITWTVSSDSNPKIDKAAGKITASRSDKDYTYGELLYVTGVYSKTGISVQKQLSIGMEQSLDTVKTVGFVKNTDKNTILDKLPANFQKGQYVMLYETYDQNGNPIDAKATNITDNNVTFISDNVLLLKNEFKDCTPATTYTIKGIEYSAVTIEPGQYVDKGGEVNITAISNKTGKKTVMNYVIGGTPILKSLVLSQPADVVADNESHEIPFVATDIDGNQITNYESIVRTTNTLSLTASDSTTLEIKQKDDGTAKVVWTDKTVGWSDSVTYDDIDRSIALTTVVVGGDSDNLILQVSDKARPVAVKSATLRTDATTAIVENDSDKLDLSDFTFVDQYGRTMDSAAMKAQAIDFFENSVSSVNGWNKALYGVKVEMNKSGSAFTASEIVTGATVIVSGAAAAVSSEFATNIDTEVNWTADNISTCGAITTGAGVVSVTVNGKVQNESVKYSVASISKADWDKATDGAGLAEASDFDYVGKALNVSYSVVPMKDVTNISIKKLNKQYISLGLEDKATGAESGVISTATDLQKSLSTAGITTPEVKDGYEQTVKLAGSYNGVAVVVPTIYATFSAGKIDFNTTTPSTISTATVSADALKLSDFFDATKANYVRKDGSDTIQASVLKLTTAQAIAVHNIVSGAGTVSQAAVNSALQQAAPKATLTFSDASPVPTKIQLAGETCVINPTNTKIGVTEMDDFGLNADADGKQKLNADGSYNLDGVVWAEDQYSVKMSGCDWTYNISDVVENIGDGAHLDKSFAINANDTNAVTVDGAEIGDTFVIKYTASKNGGSASATIKVTVGADILSRISTNAGDNTDKNFRINKLDYAY